MGREDQPLLSGPSQRQLGSPNVPLVYVIMLAISFFFAFTAFSGAQNLESSIDLGKVSGTTALGILYIVFTVSCLIGPRVVSFFGPKISIFFQEAAFALFIASQLKPEVYTVYPMAAILGFGASAMWVAQGDYVSFLSVMYSRRKGLADTASSGLFQGVFFGIYQLCQVSGNLISFFILSGGNSNQSDDHKAPKHTVNLLLIIYLICVGVGLAVLTVGVPSKSSIMAQVQRDEVPKSPPGLLDTVKLLATPKMAFLVPLFLVGGLESAFVWSDFTGDVITKSINQATVGKVMAVFGVTNAVCSFLLGRFSDRVGRPIIFAFGFAVHLGCCAWLLVAPNDATTLTLNRIYAIAALWGLGDAIWNTVTSALLTACFENDTEAAFSNFKMFQSVGTSAAFFYSAHLSLHTKLYILVGALALGAVTLSINLACFGLERKRALVEL